MLDKANALILWFDQLGIEDVPLVGGKNASLGEMYSNLTAEGVPIPNGFAITAKAYFYIVEKAGIRDQIRQILTGLDTRNVVDLHDRGHRIRELIKGAELPPDLKQQISEAYRNLCGAYNAEKKDIDVAVRSSATAEDLPDASFAGQQETFLNIRGETALFEACKKCFASLFTDRAISYRVDKSFDHFKVGLSIGVQKMVRSDKACSGVMFSLDTESGFEDVVLINASYGLGENIVLGAVNPDEYIVFKPTLKQGFKPILKKKLGSKEMMMIYDAFGGSKSTQNVAVYDADRKKFCLNEDEILQLARWACIIEDHYSAKAGHHKPMDIEWAKDGMTGKLFIVQARPETVNSRKNKKKLIKFVMKEKSEVLVTGQSVGEKIGAGKVRVIEDVHNISQFRDGEVLVTDMTDPDWEPIMKVASAIVTNRGGRTCFSGDTLLLTNKGFMDFKQIYEEGHEGLLTLSFNKETQKIEWKSILASMKKQSELNVVSVSLSGRIKDNTLKLTPDHKMVNLREGKIVDTEIREMLENNEMVCLADKIPDLQISSGKDKKLAYLLGGIMTDGSIYRSKTHGEVQFIQKNTVEKQEFINQMQECMTSLFNKPFVPFEKKVSSGMIRGKEARGQATAYRLYSKQIAYEMHEQEQKIVTTLLNGSQELACAFLAGVIDGDGSFHNNRIQIYVSEKSLLQAVVVSCLKLGIMPQLTKNRNIYNVQIVEKLNEILAHTKRVKGVVKERTIKTRFFSAKQILKNNVKGQYKLRRDKNLYVSDEELRKLGDEKINCLLNGNLRMYRVMDIKESLYDDVYNITVSDNHTYVVFSENLTPVIVNNCHAAIISRELGIPCIVGTETASKKLFTSQEVTVDASQGEKGYVYSGLLKFERQEQDLENIPKTKTKICMNIGNPEQAFEQSFIPNEGVGLAREEFIISSEIKIHPLALMHYNELKDEAVKAEIDKLTAGYTDKTLYFIDSLARGVAMIAAAFYPKKVIVRMSDFKSNEYANLIGGREFEPHEDNPMIGWRGASRYYMGNYKEAFGLECRAMLKVRNEMGLTNLEVMIPFPRTVEEAKKCVDVMAQNGLRQGENGLRVIGMCEIPSDVILADEFLDVFDGFSIGSNDLTQLTLGLDRDSELVSSVYNERNPAVKKLIKMVIEVCNRRGKYIGICGEAPSTFIDFAKFLVECGIQSMSLSPDSIIKTTLAVSELEKSLGINP